MKIRVLFSVLALLLTTTASAQGMEQMLQPLPYDAQTRYGKLDNGLTYYIRHNEYPKGQANFYIAQTVGSVQEEDDQRGLAHFLEHMCFNGTENFPENSLIRYLETLGSSMPIRVLRKLSTTSITCLQVARQPSTLSCSSCTTGATT